MASCLGGSGSGFFQMLAKVKTFFPNTILTVSHLGDLSIEVLRLIELDLLPDLAILPMQTLFQVEESTRVQ